MRPLVDRNPTVVDIHGPLGDRQAQPGAAPFARASGIDSEEAVKDAFAMLGRNAWPFVANYQQRLFPIRSTNVAVAYTIMMVSTRA
jgi:hypothetical protein